MISMLRVPMEKPDNMKEQMGNISKTTQKNQNEMLEIKYAVTEMKNAFVWTHQ